MMYLSPKELEKRANEKREAIKKQQEQEEAARQKELMTGQSKVVTQSKPDVYTPKKSTSTPTSANSNINIQTIDPKKVTPQVSQSTIDNAIYVAKNIDPNQKIDSDTKNSINNVLEKASEDISNDISGSSSLIEMVNKSRQDKLQKEFEQTDLYNKIVNKYEEAFPSRLLNQNTTISEKTNDSITREDAKNILSGKKENTTSFTKKEIKKFVEDTDPTKIRSDAGDALIGVGKSLAQGITGLFAPEMDLPANMLEWYRQATTNDKYKTVTKPSEKIYSNLQYSNKTQADIGNLVTIAQLLDGLQTLYGGPSVMSDALTKLEGKAVEGLAKRLFWEETGSGTITNKSGVSKYINASNDYLPTNAKYYFGDKNHVLEVNFKNNSITLKGFIRKSSLADKTRFAGEWNEINKALSNTFKGSNVSRIGSDIVIKGGSMVPSVISGLTAGQVASSYLKNIKLINPVVNDKISKPNIEEAPKQKVISKETPTQTTKETPVKTVEKTPTQNESKLTLETIEKNGAFDNIKPGSKLDVSNFLKNTTPGSSKGYIKVPLEDVKQIPSESLNKIMEDFKIKDINKLADNFPVIRVDVDNSEYNLPSNLVDRIKRLYETDVKNLTIDRVKIGKSGNSADIYAISENGETILLKAKANKDNKIAQQKSFFTPEKIKTLLKTNKEFSSNPYLTVIEKDGKKLLQFKGEKSNFTIIPTALNNDLKVENLKIGDKIKVDSNLLNGRGEMRVMEKKDNGDKDIYADTLQDDNDRVVTVRKNGGFLPKDNKINLSKVKIGTGDKTRYINPIDFPEAVELTKNIIKKFPKVVNFNKPGKGGDYSPLNDEIRLSIDLFKKGRREEATAVLLHELGHAIDYISNTVKTSGYSLEAKIVGIQKFLEQDVKKALKTDDKLLDEAMDLSIWWTPYDPTKNKAYTRYRNSNEELFAQTMSVFFTAPAELEKRAPNLFNLLLDNLQRSPEIAKAYEDLQALLTGDNILALRHEKIVNMFKEGDLKLKEIDRTRRAISTSDVFSNIIYLFQDRVEPIAREIRKAEKAGKAPESDPIPFLREMYRIDSIERGILDREFGGVMGKINEDEVLKSDGYAYLGEELFLERILYGDRGELPNALGLRPEDAEDLLGKGIKVDKKEITNGENTIGFLEKELGKDRYDNVKQFAAEFRQAYKNILLMDDNLYTQEVRDLIEKGDYYIPFQPVDYLNKRTTIRVKHQTGSLRDIENPIHTALKKAAKIIDKSVRNTAAIKTIEAFEEIDPDLVIPAKRDKNGNFVRPDIPGLELFTYMVKGKYKGVYIDKIFAKILTSTEIDPTTLSYITKMLTPFTVINKLVKPLYTSLSMSFQIKNVLFRDYPETVAYTGKSYGEIAKYYIKNFKNALDKSSGKYNKFVEKAYEEGVITPEYYNVSPDEKLYYSVNKLAGKFGLSWYQGEVNKFKHVLAIVDGMSAIGSSFEALPKLAVYDMLSDGGTKDLTPEQRRFIIEKVGSPDFSTRGVLSPILSKLLLFYNANIQGTTRFVKALSGKLGYTKEDRKISQKYAWLELVLPGVIAAIYTVLAERGVFGEDTQIGYLGFSEYNKRQYVVFPNGIKIVLPQGATFFKSLVYQLLKSKDGEDIIKAIMNATEDQLPNASPGGKIVKETSSFLQGKNIYDSFRDSMVFTDEEMSRDLSSRVKKMLWRQVSNLGLSTFFVNNRREGESLKGYLKENPPILGPLKKSFIAEYGPGFDELATSEREKEKKITADNKAQVRDFEKKYKRDIKKDTSREELNKIISQALYDYAEDYLNKNVGKEDPKTLEKNLKYIQEDLKNQYYYMIGMTEYNIIKNSSSNKVKVAAIKSYYNTKLNKDTNKLVEMMGVLLLDGAISNTVFDQVLNDIYHK